MSLITPELMQLYGNELRNAQFQFATSMPSNPHWYTLKRNWRNKSMFDEVVLATRAYGHTEYFAGIPWQMFNVNDKKYWTVKGGEIDTGDGNSTILINMKPRDNFEETPYDEIAHDYDAAFSDEESKEEERIVFEEVLGDLTGKSVLDIGCGTGLFFEWNKDKLKSYVGVDPSGPMLRILAQRHDLGDWGELVQSKFEEYAGPKVDVAICMFGSAAYINRSFLEGIRHYLNPGGRFVIMANEEGYTPVTYERLGIYQDFTSGVLDLPGEITKVNHYYVQAGTV